MKVEGGETVQSDRGLGGRAVVRRGPFPRPLIQPHLRVLCLCSFYVRVRPDQLYFVSIVMFVLRGSTGGGTNELKNTLPHIRLHLGPRYK